MFRGSRRVLGNVMVLAQVNAKGVTPASLSAFTAAQQIGGDVTALVSGKAAAETVSKVSGVSKVLYGEGSSVEHDLAENITNMVLGKAEGFTHILAPSSAMGKSVAPRLGALLDAQPLTDVAEIHSEDTFTRGTYAGNVVTKVKSNDKVKIMTVRGASFDKAAAEGGSAAVEEIPSSESGQSAFVSAASASSDKPDLQSADVIVSGGRGMKDPSNWHLIESLAGKMNAAVGATRAVVDAEWVASDLQVGQTGKIVAPQLYVACGISGAIQHVTGMKDSKTIVAINTDEEAPIMALADYGLVADALKAVPEMTEKL
eukprot:TRINITY_DN33537_c0_g1_i1.p1 TRINITY_DN33537_c0_g1~~TRINITY_DN33537_c0_g1_i1.p1  ORF type:complete len:332 (+),score=110.14 TRINITY_DN33537_c0_g1_i1:54-998(+)